MDLKPKEDAIPDPKTILLTTPPYQAFIVRDENFLDTLRIEFYQKPIDCFCQTCQMDSTFKRVENFLPGIYNPREFTPIDFSTDSEGRKEIPDILSFRKLDKDQNFVYMNIPVKIYSFSERFFTVRYICTRCNSQLLSFFFKIEKSKLIKIGQYPSIYDLEKNNIKKYYKLLGEEKASELKEAIRLDANGIGIGAFVYLRRVFEYVIEIVHQEANKLDTWVETGYATLRFEEKILHLKDLLPVFVTENRKIYSVLSLGIHELSEDQCKTFFEPMKIMIELILDQMMEKLERIAKEKAAQSTLSQIIGTLKS